MRKLCDLDWSIRILTYYITIGIRSYCEGQILDRVTTEILTGPVTLRTPSNTWFGS